MSALTDFGNTLSAYVAVHCLGGAQYITILTLAGAVPVLLISLFIPKMISRMEKFRLTIITRAIALVLYVLIYVTGYENTGVVLVLYVLKSLFAESAVLHQSCLWRIVWSMDSL